LVELQFGVRQGLRMLPSHNAVVDPLSPETVVMCRQSAMFDWEQFGLALDVESVADVENETVEEWTYLRSVEKEGDAKHPKRRMGCDSQGAGGFS